MNLRRTLAFTRRTLLQFRHDRRTLAFVLIMPLMMMLIFGYTFGGEPKNLNVAIVNLDDGVPIPGTTENISFAQTIVDNLDDETFIVSYSKGLEIARSDLSEANIWGVIYFPQNFSQNLVLRFSPLGTGTEFSKIDIYLDDSNPNIASTIMKGLQAAILETHQNLKDVFNLPTEAEPVVFDAYLEYGDVADIEFIDYFAPAIICFAIMMVTAMLTIILFVFERRNGTLQRLLASPASEAEIVFGYALAFAVIGLCQSLVILIAAILVFDIVIVGSVVLALVVVMLLAIGHQGLGILLSSAAKNELQAIQFIPLIIFPSVLLTGLFWPIESIPAYLQPLSYFIPLRYGIDAERSIMLRGWGIEGVWLEILILIGFAVLTLTLAILMLKRRKE
jgi:ABC-2 type transport system permease protein